MATREEAGAGGVRHSRVSGAMGVGRQGRLARRGGVTAAREGVAAIAALRSRALVRRGVVVKRVDANGNAAAVVVVKVVDVEDAGVEGDGVGKA